MALNDDFNFAAERVSQLPKRPANDILLQLYALYKQGNAGDASGDRPGFADFEGRAKFDAWNKLSGKSTDEAKQEYISLVEKLEAEAAG
ncbi:MAG: acyl-CoA-binding protein [SAR324 cluster bacterium]|nr:acyl-CoA-binding protein [SAR324 cluster bacterium]MBL7035498.1 acyl-CoA-binding protein [SAR324 cluster bacterium]